MYLFTAIFIMAMVTYIPRVIPLTCFNRQIKSVYIKSFLYYIPYAVLGAMTFPHVLYSTSNIIFAGVGVAAAVLLGYFKRNLITVAVIAVGVVYLCNFFFAA